MRRRTLVVLFVCVLAALAGWGVVHFGWVYRVRHAAPDPAPLTKIASAATWAEAIEKAKADRGEQAGPPAETPPELKHYSERYWFLATQVAEIEKHRIHTCQDYLDLAALIVRGDMVSVPAVTDSYVLMGVGEKADDSEFTPYEEEDKVDEDVAAKTQSAAKPFRDYGPLQTLARNFAGRSFDINNPSDRQAMKIEMLKSLRPQALKVLEEIASAYHRQFDRPLAVSSLVRPEQYQRALRRVNRNAVLIETPPHSTGLAFDIDYRYMGGPEQSFVMRELARLKLEGRIEAIRERNANYHVFVFLNGRRPPDELITASLEKAGAPDPEANHASSKPKQVKSKPRQARRPRANPKQRRSRR